MLRPQHVCALITTAGLAACAQTVSTPSPARATANSPQASRDYEAPSGAFRIAVPNGILLKHDFKRTYMTNGGWKAFVEPGSHGQPLVALVLSGSNRITDAELRIGVSDGPSEIYRCTDRPGSAIGLSGLETINGTTFTHFHAGDAAMSHYLDVQAYRTVHDGRCYAIDLWVAGTNPQVYDPPVTPPFRRTEAMRRLHALLATFRFNY